VGKPLKIVASIASAGGSVPASSASIPDTIVAPSFASVAAINSSQGSGIGIGSGGGSLVKSSICAETVEDVETENCGIAKKAIANKHTVGVNRRSLISLNLSW